MKKLLYLKENTFEKTSVPKRKPVQNKVKTIFEEKNLLYQKENALEKTLINCQNEVKLILKKTSVPKRKCFWKILLYLKENTFEKTSVPKRKQVQNKVKQTFEEEKTSVPKKNALEKNTYLLSKWSNMTFEKYFCT